MSDELTLKELRTACLKAIPLDVKTPGTMQRYIDAMKIYINRLEEEHHRALAAADIAKDYGAASMAHTIRLNWTELIKLVPGETFRTFKQAALNRWIAREKNMDKIFFARTMRAGAISKAPYGVYHDNCDSPQPYSEHYTFEEAKTEAFRLNQIAIELDEIKGDHEKE